ncbi:MAG: ATP-binding protein, partial [Thiohalomonadales bacterium]
MHGMERHYTSLLHELLRLFPCVALVGVRQCGKTTLLQKLAPDWRRYDMEKSDDVEVVTRDPDLFFRLNPEKIAIDECQLFPELFPALRVAIDANRNQPGRFVITGSSSPELLQSISESLAGRIAIIEMAQLSPTEAHAQPPSELYPLIVEQKPTETFLQLPARISLTEQHDYWFRGGYPEPWIKNQPRFNRLWMQNYLQTYIERDILRLFPGINRQKYRLFIQLLGNLSGTIINYSDIARALSVSQPTARDYMQIAHGSFVWRNIPAYEKNASKRIVKHPKGYLRDSGLLHFLLHLSKPENLLTHPQMGHSWEAMVIETILRELNAQGITYNYYHYRTGGGAEIDLILEGEF